MDKYINQKCNYMMGWKKYEKKIDNISLLSIYNDNAPVGADEFMPAAILYNVGYEICSLLPEFPMIFAVHSDTDNLHVHFAVVPISLETGRKLCFDNAMQFSLLGEIRKILKKHDVKIDLVWE